jgi:uncharacterized protein
MSINDKASLFLYFLISYSWSWVAWLWPSDERNLSLHVGSLALTISLKAALRLLGDLGPGVAALGLTIGEHGLDGLREFFRSLNPLRIGAKNLSAFVLGPLALIVVTILLTQRQGIQFPIVRTSETWVRLFAINLPFAPLWEELGWRAYMLRRLQSVHGAFLSSVLVGLIWGFWHAPLYLSPKNEGWNGRFFVCFLLFTLGVSVILTWVYNATDESLCAVILLHASLNASTIALLGPSMSQFGLPPFVFVTVGVWFIACLVLLAVGPNLSYMRKAADTRQA